MCDPCFWDNVIKGILSNVSPLTWPIAILIIALVFRGDISLLIRKMKEANTPWGNFKFAVPELDVFIPRPYQPSPAGAKVEEIVVPKLSEIEIEENRQRALKRIEEDAKRVGYKRGTLRPLPNGAFGVNWEVEVSDGFKIKD